MNVGSEGGSGSSRGQDFDLNLAPIIDCFTVLITFMLVSAAFLSIGVMDAGIGAAGQTAATQTPPVEVIQIEMQLQSGLEIKLEGQVVQTIRLASQNGTWDFDGLIRELKGFKQKWPQIESLVLNAANDVEYLHLIKCMEKIRKIFPGILLVGF